jgi:hypothetical protein
MNFEALVSPKYLRHGFVLQQVSGIKDICESTIHRIFQLTTAKAMLHSNSLTQTNNKPKQCRLLVFFNLLEMQILQLNICFPPQNLNWGDIKFTTTVLCVLAGHLGYS